MYFLMKYLTRMSHLFVKIVITKAEESLVATLHAAKV